jgi:hypothetical protein
MFYQPCSEDGFIYTKNNLSRPVQNAKLLEAKKEKGQKF